MGNKPVKQKSENNKPNVTNINVQPNVVIVPNELSETDYTFLMSQSGM